MTDTLSAILAIPILILFTLTLECTRIGCVWLYRSYGGGRRHAPDPPARS